MSIEMKTHDDALVEILTEELPPLSILPLAEVLKKQIGQLLQKAECEYESITYFATPRRLAVHIKNLVAQQPDQTIERRGPAYQNAFDQSGQPSKACTGFARSLGIEPKELIKIKTEQGEWVGYKKAVAGQSITVLLPKIIETALSDLPMKRRMRWGDSNISFICPIHSILLLYGESIIAASILGYTTGRVTRGHRFMSPDWITIPHPALYESLLETEGFVIADFTKRKNKIRALAEKALVEKINQGGTVLIEEALLDEVTGLVEWPYALCGTFSKDFLSLPKEVLISAMQTHQRYFPVQSKEALMPYFIVICNIESHDLKRVVTGNERVLRARLSDAAFFYSEDQKESLDVRIKHLKNMLFQAELGTLYDKAERMSKLAAHIAQILTLNEEHAEMAAWLAKTDLTTQMVGEFPELQGVMGYYYAAHAGEDPAVCLAIKEHYLPKTSGGLLPQSALGQILSLADKIDTLVGYFGLNLIPSGEKDPYGLKRASIGIIRILIEKHLSLDIKALLEVAYQGFNTPLKNKDVVNAIFNFLYERLRAWYLDQGIAADIFASVAALSPSNFYDFDQRLMAVKSFKDLAAAESLSIANKRVGNILNKSEVKITSQTIDQSLFEHDAEKILSEQLEAKRKMLSMLSAKHQYEQMLMNLAELREPVDNFFDHVMVMTEDSKRRNNRLLLLKKLRHLFLQVADIALLQ